MKLVFVRPNMHEGRSSDAMEPLAFAILTSLTPTDVDVRLFDERLEAVPFDVEADLVAMTVETYTARRAYRIAAEFRRRGVSVVLGGYHPTFLPDEALCYADAVVQGDAEGLWPTVVEDARRGRLRRLYRQDDFPSLDGVRPDRSLFHDKGYARIAMLQYARGCKYNCDFCSIRAFYGANLRQRPVRDVVDEIERIGRKDVFFVDDNIFVDIPKAKELFRALVPLRIRWSCQVSIDVARDAELLQLMEKSGCTVAIVGFESLDEANLKQMNKGWSFRYGDYATSVRKLHDHGVMIYGSFVFGYDHDTPDSFDAAVEFAVENKFFVGNFNPLTPTPGAPLMERLRREGRLLHDRWWLDGNYRYGDATFEPRGMSAAELTQGCYRARSQFNRYGSIARRALDWRTNLRSPHRLGLFVVCNLVSRREIHAKQGVRLGGAGALEPSLEGVPT